MVLLIVAASQFCQPEEGFPLTPAGEFAYALCESDEYGYRTAFCMDASSPSFIKMEDICTPKSKLKHPPFGSKRMTWNFDVGLVFVFDL